MNKYYYKKHTPRNKKKLVSFIGIGFILSGVICLLYVFFPLLSWQLYLEPVFAADSVASPIPESDLIEKFSVKSFLSDKPESDSKTYLDANNWYPGYSEHTNFPRTPFYTLSIPKLQIVNAGVSTVDTDLSQHLVQYAGTALPPEKGNAVIFGHSTIPQWFNPEDYKTIFANLHTLRNDDKIIVGINNVLYTYKVQRISITDPEDTSMLEQHVDNSYLTLITCTPPGTIWKRLVVEAKLME